MEDTSENEFGLREQRISVTTWPSRGGLEPLAVSASADSHDQEMEGNTHRESARGPLPLETVGRSGPALSSESAVRVDGAARDSTVEAQSPVLPDEKRGSDDGRWASGSRGSPYSSELLVDDAEHSEISDGVSGWNLGESGHEDVQRGSLGRVSPSECLSSCSEGSSACDAGHVMSNQNNEHMGQHEMATGACTVDDLTHSRSDGTLSMVVHAQVDERLSVDEDDYAASRNDSKSAWTPKVAGKTTSAPRKMFNDVRARVRGSLRSLRGGSRGSSEASDMSQADPIRTLREGSLEDDREACSPPETSPLDSNRKDIQHRKSSTRTERSQESAYSEVWFSGAADDQEQQGRVRSSRASSGQFEQDEQVGEVAGGDSALRFGHPAAGVHPGLPPYERERRESAPSFRDPESPTHVIDHSSPPDQEFSAGRASAVPHRSVIDRLSRYALSSSWPRMGVRRSSMRRATFEGKSTVQAS